MPASTFANRFSPLVFALVLLAACGDDDGPAPSADAGVDARVSDSGDPTPPTVVFTAPDDGALEVGRETSLVVRFSEPMDRSQGTVRVSPGGAVVVVGRDAQTSWDAPGRELTVQLGAPLPSGELTVTLEVDFRDAAGNPLAAAHSWAFATVDDDRPAVVATTPAEGASALSARLAEIAIEFDEAMDIGSGRLSLGAPGTVATPVWDDPLHARFPVEGLSYGSSYRVVLESFRDAAGNPLDLAPYLGDGAIDFSTGPDADAPRVVRASLVDGQVDVDPSRNATLVITFDEAMDARERTSTLSEGTSTVTLSGRWSAANRVITFDVTGALEFGSTYALALDALSDIAGNSLDPVPYLADGELDFTVGADAFPPFVLMATPAEGSTDIPYAETSELVVQFSEAMNTTIVAASLSDGTTDTPLTGVWIGDTTLTFPVVDLLRASATYALDLRGFEDALGNPLDATHPSLGDGRLDFRTEGPRGESCRDPLDASAAVVVGGVTTWDISASSVTSREGGTDACDTTTTDNGPDAVLVYQKVSAAASAGGRLLRVRTNTTGTLDTHDVAIRSASCEATTPPLKCDAASVRHDLYVDAPAGPVYIWVARLSNSAFPFLTVTVEEVTAQPEGESCTAPFTTASAIYMPPATAGGPHTFTIPENSIWSYDIERVQTANSPFACDTGTTGFDAVIRFEKATTDSILEVTLDRATGTFTTDELAIGAFATCNVGATTMSLGCRTAVNANEQTLYVDAAAGPVYFWVAKEQAGITRSPATVPPDRGFPTAIVTIREIPAAPGEACARAFNVAAPGATPVAGTSSQRLEAPSCFGAASNVEWYAYTLREDAVTVRSNVAGGVALFDPDVQAPIVCVNNANARPVARYLRAGQRVCIAVEQGRGISSLDITDVVYTGLGGEGTALEVARPLTETGTEVSIVGDAWMGVTSSSIYMRHLSSALIEFSKRGGDRAIVRDSASGVSSSNVGSGGTVAGDAVFSLDETSSASNPRVFQLFDGSAGLWAPRAWDTPPLAYVARAARAITFDGTNIVYATSSATPPTTPITFYSLPAAASATPTRLGSNNALTTAYGIAADNTFLYVAGDVGGVRGVYRLRRSELGNPATIPTPLATAISVSTSTLQSVAVIVDSFTAPANLYFRNLDGAVEAIAGPASASPTHLGPVIERGKDGDHAMALDAATGALYLFETVTDTTGTFVRFDP